MKKNILIVEDDKTLYSALQTKLEAEGMTVTISKDGNEALEALSNKSFDLILLDILMPVLNGIQFLEHIKKTKVNLPYVIVLSNLADPEKEKKVLELGANKYLIKSDTSLTQIVEEIQKS